MKQSNININMCNLLLLWRVVDVLVRGWGGRWASWRSRAGWRWRLGSRRGRVGLLVISGWILLILISCVSGLGRGWIFSSFIWIMGVKRAFDMVSLSFDLVMAEWCHIVMRLLWGPLVKSFRRLQRYFTQ